MKIPVRIKDIAEKLGVSEVTVSLALRDHPRISPRRRQQVRQMAEALGYRPNAMAAALAHRKWTLSRHAVTNTLAWINAWPDPAELRRFHEFDSYWKGAFQEAEKRGYRLEEFIVNETMSAARLKKILMTRNIRGLLLPPQKTIRNVLEQLDYSSLAAVRFGRSVLYPPVSLISHSQANDVEIALQAMNKKNYHRIGYVTSVKFQRVTLFDAGYLKVQATLPPEQQIPLLILEDHVQPVELVRKKIREWMSRYRPEAILTTEGNMKLLLAAAGYRVPEDVALAATSVSDCDADAGIFQNPEEIGRVGASTVIGLIQSSTFGVPEYCQDILVRGKWVEGSSLPGGGGKKRFPQIRAAS